MKKLAMATAAIAVSVSAAFADNNGLVVENSYPLPNEIRSGRHKEPQQLMIVTFPSQNTNGEDLKCLIYTNSSYYADTGAGGASCNWTAPKGPAGMGN